MSAPPNVFAIPEGADFVRVFADGFFARYGGIGPAKMAQIQVIVTTSRAREAIEEALADQRPSAGPLPRVILVTELVNRPKAATGMPPAVSATSRQLHLTRLVEAFLNANAKSGANMAPTAAAADLAADLALLLDQMHDTGIAPDLLDQALGDAALTDNAATHWSDLRRFLDIVCQAWPAILSEHPSGPLDARQRQRLALEKLQARWRKEPSTAPVLAVGSTGSVASTAMLLAEIARLEHGAVVLPGLDPKQDPTIWPAVTDDHPMGPFQSLLNTLSITPADVVPWTQIGKLPRQMLLTQALRPAPVTDFWPQAVPTLKESLREAMDGFAVLEADSPQREAEAIAVAVREALEVPERTAAIIPADAALGRRITAALASFGIAADDTMGLPLLSSAPGRLMLLALRVATRPEDPVTLVALLQHPLLTIGRARRQHLGIARRYEQSVLRQGAGWSSLPPWPKSTDADQAWLDALAAALAPLGNALSQQASLSDLLWAHEETITALTALPDHDLPGVFAGEAGQQLEAQLSLLHRDAPAFGNGPVPAYEALLRSLFDGAQLRPRPREAHPRVSISGTREARFVQADLIILAGLNDGGWPKVADPGPWLSRQMRQGIGLPSPEREIGLSAHDFLQAACRPEVLITRATKVDGTATVASRWLIRLETLVRGIDQTAWAETLRRGARYTDLGKRHAEPPKTIPRAERPRANPPLDARPRRLSVTTIETLIRDAYAVYAKEVLRLRPVDPLGRAPDMRDRGTVIHTILQRFVAYADPWPGPDLAVGILKDTADEVLAEDVPWPEQRRLWRARVARFAKWLVLGEDDRRARGTPLALERKGKMDLDLPNGPLEVRAKADRIDRLADGNVAIYDYKTGAPPSKKQIGQFSHQLHLQAAILAEGGFDGVPALRATDGAYIGLNARRKDEKPPASVDLSEDLEQHRQNVVHLLAAYDTGAPYVSRGRPELINFQGDYDHLARLDEWAEQDA
ncbi:MAG: PD-(D/E)XK nuclease family protein [Pseudomonadota bacterium]